MTKLNLIQIAKMSGVSRSTVSRVINDHPNVSDDVRERVLKIIKDTGYQPNLSARSLRSQRSNIIGLVLPQQVGSLFSDPYFPVLAQGVTEACNDYKKTLALFIDDKDEEVVKRITQEGLLDGFVFQSAKLSDRLTEKILVKSNIPFVIVGRPMISDLTYIDVDNVAGSYQAVKHLLRLGYKKIATITGDLETNAGKDRLMGYRQAMMEEVGSVDEDLIGDGEFNEAKAYQVTRSLINRGIEAIFVASDLMARGAIRAIDESGFRVPEDIGIVGYDDLAPATSSHPMLTTVHQPVREFGYKAVELLLEKINNEDAPITQIKMDVELIIRDSCGAKQYASLARSK